MEEGSQRVTCVQDPSSVGRPDTFSGNVKLYSTSSGEDTRLFDILTEAFRTRLCTRIGQMASAARRGGNGSQRTLAACAPDGRGACVLDASRQDPTRTQFSREADQIDQAVLVDLKPWCCAELGASIGHVVVSPAAGMIQVCCLPAACLTSKQRVGRLIG